jgi:hypothetical protein
LQVCNPHGPVCMVEPNSFTLSSWPSEYLGLLVWAKKHVFSKEDQLTFKRHKISRPKEMLRADKAKMAYK